MVSKFGVRDEGSETVRSMNDIIAERKPTSLDVGLCQYGGFEMQDTFLSRFYTISTLFMVL